MLLSTRNLEILSEEYERARWVNNCSARRVSLSAYRVGGEITYRDPTANSCFSIFNNKKLINFVNHVRLLSFLSNVLRTIIIAKDQPFYYLQIDGTNIVTIR